MAKKVLMSSAVIEELEKEYGKSAMDLFHDLDFNQLSGPKLPNKENMNLQMQSENDAQKAAD